MARKCSFDAMSVDELWELHAELSQVLSVLTCATRTWETIGAVTARRDGPTWHGRYADQ